MYNPIAPPTNQTTPRCALSRGAHPRFWAPPMASELRNQMPRAPATLHEGNVDGESCCSRPYGEWYCWQRKKKGGVGPRARWRGARVDAIRVGLWGESSIHTFNALRPALRTPFEVRKGGCCNGSRTAMLRTRKLCWQAIQICKPDSSARMPRGSRLF